MLFLRLFVEATPDDAASIAERVRERISSPQRGTARVAGVRAYWKIGDWQEVTIEMDDWHGGQAAFSSVLEAMGHGWIRPQATEGIWNAGDGSTFLEPQVRWAHIEVLD
jgi:hypothetical protein